MKQEIPTPHARITAMGIHVPERVLSNSDLESMVETSDEWILQRTGIRERRVTGDEEFTSTLAIGAVHDLLENAEKTVEDVDAVIVTTLTPDFFTPSVAAMVQGHFGVRNAAVMDLNAACAGFVYGLSVANGLIAAGTNRKVLVISAETLSKITDYTDRTTCVLFGDAAGAALVEKNEDSTETSGLISFLFDSNGELGDNLYCTALADRINGAKTEPGQFIRQNGRGVYTWAINKVPKGIAQLAEMADIPLEEVDWIVPHSANLRMVESIAEKVGVGMDKILTSVEEYGNTSSVTIPLALDLAERRGQLEKGDAIILYGFGGGLTHAGTLMRW
jgi:3-oxoacyl-[acyl-carrier-protein] synthase III